MTVADPALEQHSDWRSSSGNGYDHKLLAMAVQYQLRQCRAEKRDAIGSTRQESTDSGEVVSRGLVLRRGQEMSWDVPVQLRAPCVRPAMSGAA